MKLYTVAHEDPRMDKLVKTKSQKNVWASCPRQISTFIFL